MNEEPILEPDLPIVDAHHHLWFTPQAAPPDPDDPDWFMTRSKPRYLFDELLADLTTGHNIRATVFVEAHAMYRSTGPAALRSAGEVEFVNGISAIAASEIFCDIAVCAAIVGNADLRLGDAVEEVLDAHLRAGGERYRGVRNVTVSDPGREGAFAGFAEIPPGILRDARFREGFARLRGRGLSYDAVVLEPQLPDLIDLARAFPDTIIVLDHVGIPVNIGSYATRREERLALWRKSIAALAACPNVNVKLGGLGQAFGGFASFKARPPASSGQLAAEWRPYIEPCIEAFGAARCMFESNFPVDSASCSYPVLWNAFKRLAAGASADEKTALFSGTAARVYRLPAGLGTCR